MQPKNHNNDNDYSQHIEESIANAEERRKQALEEQKSLADQELEDISGGAQVSPFGDIIKPQTDGMFSSSNTLSF